MIISFFSTGTGGGVAPVDYLTAREVLAYDENRNLIRDDTGQPQTKIRDPLPEVLHGNPDQTRHLIDASPNKWSYTAGVISFAEGDDPRVLRAAVMYQRSGFGKALVVGRPDDVKQKLEEAGLGDAVVNGSVAILSDSGSSVGRAAMRVGQAGRPSRVAVPPSVLIATSE